MVRSKTKSLTLKVILTLVLGFIFIDQAPGQTTNTWQVMAPVQLQQEEAIKIVLNDLKTYGNEVGITFQVVDDQGAINGPTILVGDPTVNQATAELLNNDQISLKGVDDEQGYEIITQQSDEGKIMIVAGSTVIGNVYGLYWLWDRMRVYKKIPDINTIRIPALKTRMSAAWGRRPSGGGSKETMQQALRQNINWVSGPAIIDLVPWDSEPEKTINAENRKKTNDLIDYAHSIHMKYFCFVLRHP